MNNTVAVAMVCKTPLAGQSKTRLSPPLTAEQCAGLSACFIRDVAATIASLGAGVAPATPSTRRRARSRRFASCCRTTSASCSKATATSASVSIKATADLLAAGHAGAVLVNSDGPTLPRSILRAAVDAVRRGDDVVLSPALDGGYTLIGLSKPHPEIFTGIPWSTADVYQTTLQRARESALAVTNVPAWYDVDDLASLRVLEAELDGSPPPCATPETIGGDAPATRRFLAALARTTP